MADDLKLRVKILEQLLSILSRNNAEDIMYDIDEYAKLHNDRAYQQGRADERAKTLDEVLSILVSDGDYGHETFSLTYLKGLLKRLKEQK